MTSSETPLSNQRRFAFPPSPLLPQRNLGLPMRSQRASTLILHRNQVRGAPQPLVSVLDLRLDRLPVAKFFELPKEIPGTLPLPSAMLTVRRTQCLEK
jgi:hypothetical protein